MGRGILRVVDFLCSPDTGQHSLGTRSAFVRLERRQGGRLADEFRQRSILVRTAGRSSDIRSYLVVHTAPQEQLTSYRLAGNTRLGCVVGPVRVRGLLHRLRDAVGRGDATDPFFERKSETGSRVFRCQWRRQLDADVHKLGGAAAARRRNGVPRFRIHGYPEQSETGVGGNTYQRFVRECPPAIRQRQTAAVGRSHRYVHAQPGVMLHAPQDRQPVAGHTAARDKERHSFLYALHTTRSLSLRIWYNRVNEKRIRYLEVAAPAPAVSISVAHFL